jgi:hypothetical protein
MAMPSRNWCMIGIEMDEAALRQAFDACLLSDSRAGSRPRSLGSV